MRLYLLLFLFVIISCNENETAITITGYAPDLKGDLIYLKEYDHFNYLDEEYILDSCFVSDKGEFQFRFNRPNNRLVTLSKVRNEPPSYRTFKYSPEDYYYSFCKNFFALTPTVYLDERVQYEITNWDSNDTDSSIEFYEDHNNKMKDYYYQIDYRSAITNEKREYLELSAVEVWSLMTKYRDEKLEYLDLNGSYPIDSFENYLKTEIVLGALNNFLLWYNAKNHRIDTVFHKDLMETYNSSDWNQNSVEYYKLTERYVTYQLNLLNGDNKLYYSPSILKMEIATKYFRENVKEDYISNLKKLTSNRKTNM